MLAIFVTALDASGRSIHELVMNVRAFEREPWRLVTSALPHANAFHLIFNVAWLWTLGTMLEERFGSFRLLGLVLLFAAGSAAAEYAIFLGVFGLIFPGIDNWAHAGGFAGGYLASLVLDPITKERGDHLALALLCLALTLVALIASFVTALPMLRQ